VRHQPHNNNNNNNIFVLNGEISVKLDTNVRHVSGHGWKGFKVMELKVKVAERWLWKSCELECS